MKAKAKPAIVTVWVPMYGDYDIRDGVYAIECLETPKMFRYQSGNRLVLERTLQGNMTGDGLFSKAFGDGSYTCDAFYYSAHEAAAAMRGWIERDLAQCRHEAVRLAALLKRLGGSDRG